MDHTLQTEVVHDRGQWQVYLVVIEPEGVTRTLLSAYHTEALARLAASSVLKAAYRRRPPPPDA